MLIPDGSEEGNSEELTEFQQTPEKCLIAFAIASGDLFHGQAQAGMDTSQI